MPETLKSKGVLAQGSPQLTLQVAHGHVSIGLSTYLFLVSIVFYPKVIQDRRVSLFDQDTPSRRWASTTRYVPAARADR